MRLGTLFNNVRVFLSNHDNSLRDCNCKLEISTAPKKAKSREPAYSQALIQNKIERSKSWESGSRSDAKVDGVSSLDRGSW